MARRYYDWQATFSRQTGSQGEMCIVVGAKNIGKTFGLRKQCIDEYIKRGSKFCEICRTKDEKKQVASTYFDKFVTLGYFEGYIFKTDSNHGYIAKEPLKDESGEFENKPEWNIICYFVALTTFQTEKKRTFASIKRFIFDEAIIDKKDKYHRYLNSEYLILANILDSVSRQQPNGEQYRVYLLGNACDLTCPYLRHLGINTIPSFGYSFYNNKHTLLHYAEPLDSEVMKRETLVGRMLNGLDESSMMYDNVFNTSNAGDIIKRPKNLKYAYSIIFNSNVFALNFSYDQGIAYITSKRPKNNEIVIALTKDDLTVDYKAIERNSTLLKSINNMFYAGQLRYDSPATRELFLYVLNFLGIR